MYKRQQLVELYSEALVTIHLVRQPPFGMIVTESMACGTPVVAFGATGLLDIVDHKVNGYLAKPFESEDLANGIEYICLLYTSPSPRDGLLSRMPSSA